VNTRVEYRYRDAANYKQFASVVLGGEITPEERQRIRAALDGGEYFIPSEVGLTDLQPRMPAFPDPEIDHVWHELDVADGITLTDDPPTHELAIHEFAAGFTGRWDVAAAMRRLGLPPYGLQRRP
jgi:hypothetical protein